MMFTLKVLMLATVAAADTTAIQLAFKNRVFNQLKSQYMNPVWEKLKDLTLPHVSFGNKYTGANMTDPKITFPHQTEAQFNDDFFVNVSDVMNNTLVANNINAQFESDFTAYFLFMKTQGHLSGTFTGLDLELRFDLTDQKAWHKEFAPKIAFQSAQFGLDTAKSNIKITGGVIGWMANFVESLFQSEIFHRIMKKAEKVVMTSMQDELNTIVAKYIQYRQYSKQIGFDFSMMQAPQDMKDTLFLDFNGTWFLNNEQGEKIYSSLMPKRIDNEIIKTTFDHDLSIIVRKEAFLSLFQVMHETKQVINLAEIYSPDEQMTFSHPFYNNFPHVEDFHPLVDFPVDIFVDIPSLQNPWIQVEETIINGGGIDVHFRCIRKDNGETLQDFTLFNWTFNSKMLLNEKWAGEGRLSAFFEDGKVNKIGRYLKLHRDTFLFSYKVNDHVGDISDNFSGYKFKNLYGMNFRKVALKYDSATQSVMFGLDVDPTMVGKWQG